MTSEQEIEVDADMPIAVSDFDGAAGDRAECANNAVAALDAHTIAVGQEKARTVDAEIGVWIGRNEELHVLAAAFDLRAGERIHVPLEVAFKVARNKPVKICIDGAL